jgi:transposase-like protein
MEGGTMSIHKNILTQHKDEVIDLYVNKKYGKQTIAKIYGVSDNNVSYWLKQWEIPNNKRTDIQKAWSERHGPTTGFKGKSHKQETKLKVSKSVKKAYSEGRHIGNYARSRIFDTLIGKVLGTYEVAYLQKLLSNNEELPKIFNSRIKTPFGTYKPDFEYPDKFIEIKSQFTLDLANGKYPELKTKDNQSQLNKIKWVVENIKPVEIIVLSKKEVLELFSKAEEKKGILYEVCKY